MAYWVKPYDGEGGQSLATLEAAPIGPFETIDDARAWIKNKIGGNFGQWDGAYDDALENWNESEEEDCGGYAITSDA